MLIGDDDRKRIAEAITAAEARTSGEIVAVIAPSSASYLHVPFLWAALAALVLPWPFIYGTWWPIQHIYLLQLIVFAALALALMHWPLRLSLVPRSTKHARAHRRALEQFLAQNLHTTVGRTGVMIFVSVAERYAEVIADAGIHQKVPDDAWTRIVDDLTDKIGTGQATQGFISAIAAVGDLLARHFPPQTRPAHALGNHLIVLPPG